MSFMRYETVAFGGSKAGLLTVGYRIYDANGLPTGPRVTAGIIEIGGGEYGTEVTFPDGFIGRITWDTGEVPPVLATASIDPPEISPQDPQDASRLNVLEADVVSIDRALTGQFTTPGVLGDGIVRTGLPEIDDCKILTRMKAFAVDQGSIPTVEHIFRDRAGRPIDISPYVFDEHLVNGAPTSDSSQSHNHPTGKIRVRVKDFLGVDTQLGTDRNPIWELDVAFAYQGSRGIARAVLEDTLTERSGIYEMFWAVADGNNKPLFVDRTLLTVERSLFPISLEVLDRDLGPPGLQEIRMRLMDSMAPENPLLDDIEFKDEQILLAIAEPIRFWNEAPPPIERYTTRNFPFRGAWISGVMAQLYMMAANHYRRNRLMHSAGGVSIDDKNKEKEYLGEGQRLWEEYKNWLYAKKVEINMKKFVGSEVSAYSTRNGW